MKVAVIVNSSPTVNGGYHFEQSIIDAINKNKNLTFEFKIVTTGKQEKGKDFSYGYGQIIFSILQNNFITNQILQMMRLHKSKFEKYLIKNKFSLCIFLSPNILALSVSKIPKVTTVWDLGHLDLSHLEEYQKSNSFLNREFYFSKSIATSAHVIVESEFTKKRVSNKYGISMEKISILNLESIVVNNFVNKKILKNTIKDNKEISILYPANIWTHKNHKFIIKIYEKLLEGGIDCILIFCGFQDNLENLNKLKIKSKIKHGIRILGRISNSELINLYNDTDILVFPSLLGPSNLPPIEALYLNKKVIAYKANQNLIKYEKCKNLKIINNFDINEWINQFLILINEEDYFTSSELILKNSQDISQFFEDLISKFDYLKFVLDYE